MIVLCTEHGSVETEHGSGEQKMDFAVPFEMEHGSQILKKDGISIVHLVGLSVVLCGSSFLNQPMFSSEV